MPIIKAKQGDQWNEVSNIVLNQGALDDAPVNDNTYGRKNNKWVQSYEKTALDTKFDEINSRKQDNIIDSSDIAAEGAKLKIADRAAVVDPVSHEVKSMGYKVLRPELSFASQVTEPNMIYEIRDNFELNGTVNMPPNCTLKFEGGSLSGVLNGNNTQIEAYPYHILKNVKIKGTWNNEYFLSEWLGASGIGNKVVDDSKAINDTLLYFKNVKLLPNKVYRILSTINMPSLSSIIGKDACLISSGNNIVINMGFRSNIEGFSVFVDKPCDVISVSSEYLGNTMTDVPSWMTGYNAMVNIRMNDIFIQAQGLDSAIAGDAIKIESNGYGIDGFWGTSIRNVIIAGRFKKGMSINTGTKAGALKNTWCTDINIENVKIDGTETGIYIAKDDVAEISKGKNPPEKIQILNCSMQCGSYSKRFIEIKQGNWISVLNCIPWDWNNSEFKLNPYIVDRSCQGVTIKTSTTDYLPQIEFTGDVKENNGVCPVIEDNIKYSINGSIKNLFEVIPQPIDWGERITRSQLLSLPNGRYNFGYSLINARFLNIPESVFGNGYLEITHSLYPGSAHIKMLTYGYNTPTLLYMFIGSAVSEDLPEWQIITSDPLEFNTDSIKRGIDKFIEKYNFKGAMGIVDGKLVKFIAKYDVRELATGRHWSIDYGTTNQMPKHASSLGNLNTLDIGKTYYNTETKKLLVWTGTKFDDVVKVLSETK